MTKQPVATMYRAQSWSRASDNSATERQPFLFYRTQDIDLIFDKLRAELDFERRRYDALQEFYIKETKWNSATATEARP